MILLPQVSEIDRETEMKHRNILIRCLAALALVAVYIVSASTFMATSTTTADARGRGRGRGYYGGGRGRGRGYGRGVYIAPPVYVAPYAAYGGCYWSRRWQRRICPY
jgi:hypothetical protein